MPKGDGPEQTCAALDRLAGTAAAVEQANVADPEAFADALSHAVHAYTGELDALRKVAPDELQDAIDDVDHAMSKHDFADAVAAARRSTRYAAAHCSARRRRPAGTALRTAAEPDQTRGSSTNTGICRSVLAW